MSVVPSLISRRGFVPLAMDELIPGVPDIFREVDVLLEDWLIDAKMTPEEDWQQVSSATSGVISY